jgi:hypothetical protein
VDASIYVIDVSGGDKIPRKGGPGVTRSDLLVINTIDLAPHVGASLDVIARDARLMRGNRPFVFTNLKRGAGLEEVVAWIGAICSTRIRSSPDSECSRDPIAEGCGERPCWFVVTGLLACRRQARRVRTGAPNDLSAKL